MFNIEYALVIYPNDINECRSGHINYVYKLNRDYTIYIVSPFKEHARKFRSIKTIDKVMRKFPGSFYSHENYLPIAIPYKLAPKDLLNFYGDRMKEKYKDIGQSKLVTKTPYNIYKDVYEYKSGKHRSKWLKD